MSTSWVGASVRARLLGNRRLGRGEHRLLPAPAASRPRSSCSLDLHMGVTSIPACRSRPPSGRWRPPSCGTFESSPVGSLQAAPPSCCRLRPGSRSRTSKNAWPISPETATPLLINWEAWARPGGLSPERRPPTPCAKRLTPLAVGRPWHLGPEWHGAGAALQVGRLGCRLRPGRGRLGGDRGRTPWGARSALGRRRRKRALRRFRGRVYGLPARLAAGRIGTGAELRAMHVAPAGLGAATGWTQPSDLWVAEARWWSRVEADAAQMRLVRSRYGPVCCGCRDRNAPRA